MERIIELRMFSFFSQKNEENKELQEKLLNEDLEGTQKATDEIRAVYLREVEESGGNPEKITKARNKAHANTTKVQEGLSKETDKLAADALMVNNAVCRRHKFLIVETFLDCASV